MKKVAIPVSIIGLISISLAALLPPTASGEVKPTASSIAATQPDRAALSRLYIAAFDRGADPTGLDYWGEVNRGGADLNEIADYFVSSDEFSNTYGDIDAQEFVDLVYRNVLSRSADEGGLSYWVGLIESGYSSGTILNGFAQSPEFKRITNQQGPESAVSTAPLQVLMIGDSIFHGIRLLRIPVGSADIVFLTEEGRQVSALPELLAAAGENGQLAAADLVVIHLGTNGWLAQYDAMFEAQVAALAPRPVLVVNTEVDRPWESTANDRIAGVAARHEHVNLVDWNAQVSGHPEWMHGDGIHPNTTGLTELAGLVTTRIAETYAPRE